VVVYLQGSGGYSRGYVVRVWDSKVEVVNRRTCIIDIWNIVRVLEEKERLI
jgi:hypothetical protein